VPEPMDPALMPRVVRTTPGDGEGDVRPDLTIEAQVKLVRAGLDAGHAQGRQHRASAGAG
jgi:hypothetical protein